jgi:membrane-associated phospholipid phosphatase
MKKITLALAATLWAAAWLRAQTQPDAGQWKTWFIQSGKEWRLPAPGPWKNEVVEVLARQKTLGEADMQEILYWNAGAPGYRWQELMSELWMQSADGILASVLLDIATYDATIAAWDSKYAWNRPRPFAADPRIKAHIPKPESPSYPCEHAVAAGVASTIIAHFFPKMADSVAHMAQRALDARVAAGAAFPGDTRAGFELGKRIAEKEIAHTKNFMPPPTWDGKIPDKPGLWRGKYAMFPLAGRSHTIVLDSGSQFRPGPPPDFAKEMEELKNYKQTFSSMSNAFYHANHSWFGEELNKKIFEYNLHLNPPLAARLYAVAAVGMYDGFVACWDAKYAYWGIRPEQYDTTYQPLFFRSPPFPGYPSGHAALSSVHAGLMSYFFPSETAHYQAKAREIGESRFQGGIHFRSDNEVALELGRQVAEAIIGRLKKDGVEAVAAQSVKNTTRSGKKQR